jgi:hypothetical protein
MDTLEALDRAIMAGCVNSMRRGPGEIVARRPREEREALERLTSDDVARLRDDVTAPKGK